MLAPPQSLHVLLMRLCSHIIKPCFPAVLAPAPAAGMLAEAGASAVLPGARDAGMLEDAGAPAVLASSMVNDRFSTAAMV
jgi:hypothetical protein